MNIDLTGKRALVGGASRGIGRAIAHELGACGAAVTLMARSEAALPPGAGHHALRVDMADPVALKKAVTAHITAHGPFHILVNNTGGPPAGPAHAAKEEDFIAAFNQHLIANHIMMQATLDGMKAEKYGRIVNIISTSVKVPIKGLGVSNTIRGAVANWAKTLAGELAPFGITVNNVLPGATATDRMEDIMAGKMKREGKTRDEIYAHEIAAIPMGRFGLPEELAQAVAFLASPAAAYITGINLPVDGGRTGSL